MTDQLTEAQGTEPNPAGPPQDRPVRQLDAMIENLATYAVPVLRDIAARAAELAVKAGEAAGPVAHKAADVTEVFGARVADKSREIATDLRREPTGEASASASSTTAGDEAPFIGAGTSLGDRGAGSVVDPGIAPSATTIADRPHP